MTRARSRPLPDLLAARARGAVTLADTAAAVCTAYRQRIPYVFGCFATLDPATGLISWASKTHPLEVGDEEFAAAEYGGPDLNLFTEIAAREQPVGALFVDTGGDVRRCRRMREFLTPRFGFTDELRLVFRAGGLTWAAAALYRGPGDPPFTSDEADLAVSVQGSVAELVQAALFRPQQGAAAVTGPTVAPAVIVVDGNDRVLNMTPAAHARIAELGGWDNGSLPSTVLVTTAAARSTPELAVNRAVATSGAWLSVRATVFAPSGPSPHRGSGDAVVTIDLASPSDISALALAARGLSAREQEVATLVLQGAATKDISASLFLSPHTVQDHLKSIFAKLGVNSRREMVRRLVLD